MLWLLITYCYDYFVYRQSTNPKPGLLGVAPPMIAAVGMMGPVRTSFPIGAQGYLENLARQPPHEKIEDAAQEILRPGPGFGRLDSNFAVHWN